MPNLAKRDAILELETLMQSIDPGFDAELKHHFGYHTYAREMKIKRDDLIVGKIHRYDTINILLSGDVSVRGEFEHAHYSAPMVWVSPAGTKRAIYAISNAMWVTLHPNPSNTQDLDKLERELIAESFAMLEAKGG